MKVVYDVTKEALLSSRLVRDGILCHFSSALVAGFTATLVASPVDVVKTRYMSRCGDCPVIANSIQYLSILNCFKVSESYNSDVHGFL